jgi:hypothetical protein
MVFQMAHKLVVHCKKSNYDLYVGRPSKWGNPFVMKNEEERDKVISQYRDWLLLQPDLLKELPTLKDKILACWCAPKACHADVLAELANK